MLSNHKGEDLILSTDVLIKLRRHNRCPQTALNIYTLHLYICSQTKMCSDTFNISHIITVCCSLENGNKIWQDLRVKLSEQIYLDNVR